MEKTNQTHFRIGGKLYRRVPSIAHCACCVFEGEDPHAEGSPCSKAPCWTDENLPYGREFILLEADDPRTDKRIWQLQMLGLEKHRLARVTDHLLRITQRGTLQRLVEKLLGRLNEVRPEEDDPWIKEQLRTYR